MSSEIYGRLPQHPKFGFVDEACLVVKFIHLSELLYKVSFHETSVCGNSCQIMKTHCLIITIDKPAADGGIIFTFLSNRPAGYQLGLVRGVRLHSQVRK